MFQLNTFHTTKYTGYITEKSKAILNEARKTTEGRHGFSLSFQTGDPLTESFNLKDHYSARPN